MEQFADEQPVLIGQTGPLNGKRWNVQNALIVGRGMDCDIVVNERQVSRHHATFTPSEEGVVVQDLGSKNGTHLNGERIEQPAVLQDGDIVQVALAQQFLYLSSDATVPLEVEGLSEMPSPEARLRLEKRSRRVWVTDVEITPPLSVAQFAMLDLLYQRNGRVVTREDLIGEIWGEEEAFEVSNQALDALVRRLRDRLKNVDDEHEYIVTVRGHGLRLDNPLEPKETEK